MISLKHSPLWTRHSFDNVRSVRSTGCRLDDGSGFNSLTVEFHVLQVRAGEPVGPELLGCFDAEAEWVAFLTAEGANGRAPG